MKDKTKNRLNTPLRSNVEYAKKKAKRSQYEYEFGNEIKNNAKDSPLARGANIANAFSYPGAPDVEFGQDNDIRESKLKRKYQEKLRQNFNVEFSDNEEINTK